MQSGWESDVCALIMWNSKVPEFLFALFTLRGGIMRFANDAEAANNFSGGITAILKGLESFRT